MRNSCYTIPTNPCPRGIENAKCIVYTGSALSNIGVLTNDRLDVILQKINDAVGGGGGLSGLYIHNQFVQAQNSANFWIGDNGRINGYLQIGTAGRLVTDNSGKLKVSPSTNSDLGGELRIGKLLFADQSVPNFNDSVSIFAQQGDFLNLQSPFNIVLDAPNLALTQHTLFNMGGAFPLILFGAQTDSLYPGPVNTFLDIFNGNPASANDIHIAFSANRTTTGKTVFGKIGMVVSDFSNGAYKGDIVISTANNAFPAEQLRVDYEGKISAQNIPHETTDVDRVVVWNPSTKVVSYRTGAETLQDGWEVVTSSASTLTLAAPNTDYVFTGTTATWTLPTLIGNTGVKFFIKNRGSGNLTVQRAGGDSLYTTTLVVSITVLPGERATISNDGVYWNI